MELAPVIKLLQNIAPLHYAEEWDNVGLLVGDEHWSAGSALMTIDLTEPVLEEARKHQVGLIIAYHPPIFHPLRRLTAATVQERIVLEAARAGIAVYSPHTALDAAPGGVNDWLAQGLLPRKGAGDVKALHAYPDLPKNEECKIVTFCQEKSVEQLRQALASIGAGHIGEYAMCSFETRGTGSFLGDESTNPSVGARGSLQHIDEIRLEMVCPKASLPLAVRMLHEFHPYDEPPLEIHQLMPRPERDIGQGRRVVLDRQVGLEEIADRVKKWLGTQRVRVARSPAAPQQFRTIGVCAGAGGSLVDEAIDQGCELYLTGEMRHHAVIAAMARGCTVVLAGHTNTERGYLKVLRKRLAKELPGLTTVISRRDTDPFRTL